MKFAALDIGGANIKAALADGNAWSRPFALWRAPEKLADELGSVLEAVGDFDRLAVTMTGELCDCYETRADGVRHILGALRAALRHRRLPGEPLVYTTDATFVSIDDATRRPESVAAANWLALATWVAGEYAACAGVLVDIGSTTTDVIAFGSGRVIATETDDTSRLASGELIYAGAQRTPICALTSEVVVGGRRVPLAAELFATTRDAYLVLGLAEDAPHDSDTADGRPATRAHARARIARVVCGDPATFAIADAVSIARQTAGALEHRIARAIDDARARAATSAGLLVASGSGEFIARRVANAVSPAFARIVSLGTETSPAASVAACAWALARLLAAREA